MAKYTAAFKNQGSIQFNEHTAAHTRKTPPGSEMREIKVRIRASIFFLKFEMKESKLHTLFNVMCSFFLHCNTMLVEVHRPVGELVQPWAGGLWICCSSWRWGETTSNARGCHQYWRERCQQLRQWPSSIDHVAYILWCVLSFFIVPPYSLTYIGLQLNWCNHGLEVFEFVVVLEGEAKQRAMSVDATDTDETGVNNFGNYRRRLSTQKLFSRKMKPGEEEGAMSGCFAAWVL